MNIYLIRHGDTELGTDGLYPKIANLSALGCSQARALVPLLISIAPDTIVTSGVERADQTAEPYLAHSKTQPVTIPEFDEIGIGNLRSKNLSEIKKKLFANPFVPDFSDYDGESSSDFEQRVIGAFDSLIMDEFEDPQKIALVTHGGPINVILDWVEHGRFTGQFVRNIHTASVTLLELNSNGFDIKYVSNTTHLDATS